MKTKTTTEHLDTGAEIESDESRLCLHIMDGRAHGDLEVVSLRQMERALADHRRVCETADPDDYCHDLDIDRIDRVIVRRRMLIRASTHDPLARAIGQRSEQGCSDWPRDADAHSRAEAASRDGDLVPCSVHLRCCGGPDRCVRHAVVRGRGRIVGGPTYWSNASVGQSGWGWTVEMVEPDAWRWSDEAG